MVSVAALDMAPIGVLAVPKSFGRPVGGDTRSEASRKPWRAMKVSRRTFYRRKAKALAEAPPQCAAHVQDWFATLGPFERLDHRAFVRRCRIELALAERQAAFGDPMASYAALRGLH